MDNIFVFCLGSIFYLGGPLLLVMGGYYLYLAIRNPKRAPEVKNWPTTEGKIADIHLIGRKSWMNNIELRYTYSVGGVEYTGKNLTLFPNTIFGKERLNEILEQYHDGQYVTVYTNPEKPKEAVIEPDLGEQDRWFLLWSIVNVVVGLFLAAVIIFGLVEG
jgi:hypothetical protein